MADGAAEVRNPAGEWREIVLVVALSVTVVATAYSGLQATKWSGVQANKYSAAAAQRAESLRASNLAGQQTLIDVNLFTDWLSAKAGSDTALADFLSARFRPEFVPAYEAWLATNPLTNPSAPASPFALPQYHLAATDTANQLQAEADADSSRARDANTTGDHYVFATMILAMVLFFGALSERFDRSRGGVVLAGLAVVSFVTGAIILGSLPRTF